MSENGPTTPTNTDGADPAVELIRKKLESLYAQEPTAKAELEEVQGLHHRSRHQQFMYDLSHSGKSLAEIQTQWHVYYTKLPDDEKHAVWREFYSNHKEARDKQQATHHAQQAAVATHTQRSQAQQPKDPRSVSDIKRQLVGHVGQRRKLQRSDHLKSLLFGLSSGLVVVVIFLFGFFNERFIAPFISPSKNVSAAPIIIDSNAAVGPESKIVIPKINVEIPVVYDEPTIDEPAIERALERGVVHYPTTSNPGEIGNGVIFGHSANNILNKGKYKFAFVLLKRLEAGDTFYLQKNGKRYVYKVFEKHIVPPTQVSVLYPTFPGKPATFTLITCDPPGTSLNRLVVYAEQISPDPATNVPSTAKTINTQPTQLPSNSPTLWYRITHWFSD